MLNDFSAGATVTEGKNKKEYKAKEKHHDRPWRLRFRFDGVTFL
jgi:hypothetical protein